MLVNATRRTLLLALLALLSTSAAGPALAVSDQLRTGDVVFRLGATDLITDLIVRLSPLPPAARRWSHVGIVVGATNGNALIAHALENGVVLESATEFTQPARAWGAVRPPAGVYADRIGARAGALLGRGFDKNLLLSESELIYCTELLVLATAAADAPVDWTLMRVPFFAEKALHPDSAWQDLLRAGWTALRH